MITLVADSVTYWSEGDETAFFTWLQSIPCVREVRGVGRELLIQVDEPALTDPDLRELIGLFHRYGVDMRQLARFAAPSRPWFHAEGMFWRTAVFGA